MKAAIVSVLFLCSPGNTLSECSFATTPTPTIATNTKSKATKSSKLTLTIGSKLNASTTGKTAQDSQHTTVLE